MNAKDYEAEWKWINTSPEAKQRSDAAKAKALSEFKKRFPRADMSKFIVQDEFDSNRKALGRVLFPDGNGSWENALIEDQKYWSQPLKDALGVNQDGGFPYQLSLPSKTSPNQSQRLILLTTQVKAFLISLTRRGRSEAWLDCLWCIYMYSFFTQSCCSFI